MLLLLLVSTLALGAASPLGGVEMKLQRGVCPEFWYSFNSSCYKYVATRTTWAEAELYCVSLRANLVSIHSLAQDEFVRHLVENHDHTQGSTWIGLSDLHKEGRWMWSDGSQVDFLFWNTDQPDNYHSNEHCVHNNHGGINWNDSPCDSVHSSVCAFPLNCCQE